MTTGVGQLTIDRADRFADIDVDVWEQAAGPGLYVSGAWFDSVEDRLTRPCSYAIAEEDGHYSAGAFYRVRADTYALFNPIRLLTDEQTLERVRRTLGEAPCAEAAKLQAGLELAGGETAALVSPFGYTHPLRRNTTANLRKGILDELDRKADQWGTGNKAVLYCAADDTALAAELWQRGYLPLFAGANCAVPRANEGIEAILSRLTRSQRSDARQEMRNFERGGLVIEPSDAFDEHIDLMARLQMALQHKYGHTTDLENEREAFRRMSHYLGDYLHLDLVRRGETTCGFVLFFVNDDVIYVKMGGFDRTVVGHKDYAYFNAGYYNMFRRAEAIGATRIEYGGGAYEAKLRRGCEAERLISYVHVPGTSRSRVARLAQIVSQVEEIEIFGPQAQRIDA
jgi:hypothetical protein